jgi:hypothetical protein
MINHKKIYNIFAVGSVTLISMFLLLGSVAQGQVGVEIGRHGVGVEVGAPINLEVQPNCPYGYYASPPYECVDQGYYAPNYFYNGIFLGVGPWANYGYGHGWGEHRFDGDNNNRGGRFNNHNTRRSERQERGRQQRTQNRGHSRP